MDMIVFLRCVYYNRYCLAGYLMALLLPPGLIFFQIGSIAWWACGILASAGLFLLARNVFGLTTYSAYKQCYYQLHRSGLKGRYRFDLDKSYCGQVAKDLAMKDFIKFCAALKE